MSDIIEYILSSTLLTVLACIVLVILFLTVLFYAIRLYFKSKYRTEVTKDLVTGKSVLAMEDRLSLLNLFFDFGADKQACKALLDLKIIDENWEEISPSASNRLKKHIAASGGYHKFVCKVRAYYNKESVEPVPNEISFEDQIVNDIEQVVSATPTYEEILVSVKDVKKKIKNAGPLAVGEMFGIPVAEMKLATKIPGLAERFYRINVQSNSTGNIYLQTAEDIVTGPGATIAGGAVGLGVGFTFGDFIGDMIDGDGDGIEGMALGLLLGVGGSILSGKFFKKLGKMWKTRKFNRLQKEYKEACHECYDHITSGRNYEIFEQNLDRAHEYWRNKSLQLENAYNNTVAEEIGPCHHYLFEQAFRLVDDIYSKVFKRREEFVGKLNTYLEEDKISLALNSLLVQEKLLLNGIEGIDSYKRTIKKRLNAVVAEAKILHKKGVLDKNEIGGLIQKKRRCRPCTYFIPDNAGVAKAS